MRVALFEPTPRVCGPVTSLLHLKEGFRRLGHTAEFVTFMKSGKPRASWGVSAERIAAEKETTGSSLLGCGWTQQMPDRIEKHKDAVAVLDEYDLIILAEPKGVVQDKEPAREYMKIDTPYYIQWLHATKTPWTTALHGPQYNFKRARWLKELFESPTWVGRGVTYGRWLDFTQSDEMGVLKQFEWEPMPLPFVPSRELIPGEPPRDSVGITGRMTPNKGPGVVAFLPLCIDVDVSLWGACAKGQGPSFSYDIWEKLAMAGGTQLWRGGPNKHTPLNPFPWEVEANGRRIRYYGNYVGNEPFATLWVHCNLTSPKFSGGLVEFATLEAAAAGRPIVANANVMDDSLHCAVVEPAIAAKSPLATARGDELAVAQVRLLADAVRVAQSMTPVQLGENVARVNTIHDPARVAAAFVNTMR